MARTPEAIVKDKVKKVLKEHGVYYFMPVQSGFGSQGLDFHCCHEGRAIFIETKAPGKKPTKLQKILMAEISRAGGAVFVIDGDTTHLEDWLHAPH